MSRHFGVPQKPTVFLSEEEIDQIDMAAVREAAVISWLGLCAAGLGITLVGSFVIISALYSLD